MTKTKSVSIASEINEQLITAAEFLGLRPNQLAEIAIRAILNMQREETTITLPLTVQQVARREAAVSHTRAVIEALSFTE